jgi:hypothetical protein
MRSSLLAHDAMLILPSCSPSAAISRRVLTCSSLSDADGDAGTEQSGLRDGVAAPAGVPLLDCSWLAAGVISVPTSLIDTDDDCAAAPCDAPQSLVRRGSLPTGPVTDDSDDEGDGADCECESSVRALVLFASDGDSGATRTPPPWPCTAATAAAFLEKMGLECTTWRPAIHFSASFHLDGTCLKRNGPSPALSSIWNSKLPPLPVLAAALPRLESERDREESERSLGGHSDEPSSSSCGRRLLLGWSSPSSAPLAPVSSLDGDLLATSSLLPWDPIPSSFILSFVGDMTPICRNPQEMES